MAVPKKDTDLVSFGQNFSTRITASPITFGLVAGDATQYASLLASFVSAYQANANARDAGTRTTPLATAKNDAKASFLSYARVLYSTVQADTSVSDANKQLLGITVRAQPSPRPIPDQAPAMDLVSVVGNVVKIRLHDAIDASRTKPVGVSFAAICSFVGATAPTDPNAYKWEGNTGRSEVNITFPDSLEPGTQVWITAMWLNEKQQAGPAATPVGAQIQFGMQAAA
jgi:hypothetical protein